MIQFNQNAWLKSYIDINKEQNRKTILRKTFFNRVNNEIFGKTMDNVRKHRDIKLGPTSKRKNF